MQVYRLWQRLSNRGKWECVGTSYEDKDRYNAMRINLIADCKRDPQYLVRNPKFQICGTVEEYTTGAYPDSRWNKEMPELHDFANVAFLTDADLHTYRIHLDGINVDERKNQKGENSFFRVTVPNLDRDKNKVEQFVWTDTYGAYINCPDGWIPLAVIERAQEMLADFLTKTVPYLVFSGRLTPPYKAMKLESERKGWPEAFQEDLTWHDARTLTEYKPAQFVWVLRKYGTHLFFDKRSLPWLTYYTQGKDGQIEGETYLCFFWNGEMLVRIDGKDAEAWLEKQE